MARTTLKVSPETAARLRATMPELSAAADRMLTIDAALVYLLDAWDAHRETPPHPSWIAKLDTERPSNGTA